MFFREATPHMKLKMVCWKVRDTSRRDNKKSINTINPATLYQIKYIRFWTRAATIATVVTMTSKTTVPAVKRKKLWFREAKGQSNACPTSQRCKQANLLSKNIPDKTPKLKTKLHASQLRFSPKPTPNEDLNLPVALLKTITVTAYKPTASSAAQAPG
jgi:hypothetical protein